MVTQHGWQRAPQCHPVIRVCQPQCPWCFLCHTSSWHTPGVASVPSVHTWGWGTRGQGCCHQAVPVGDPKVRPGSPCVPARLQQPWNSPSRAGRAGGRLNLSQWELQPRRRWPRLRRAESPSHNRRQSCLSKQGPPAGQGCLQGQLDSLTQQLCPGTVPKLSPQSQDLPQCPPPQGAG